MGFALLLVSVALLSLLALGALLFVPVMKRQRQSIAQRETLSREYAARAGYEEARNRMELPSFRLGFHETVFFERVVNGCRTEVRIRRQPDVVLTLDGRVLEGLDRQTANVRATAMDANFRRVRLARSIEVYLVESRSFAPSSAPEVRVWGVLARADRGWLQQIGLFLERGYLSERSRRPSLPGSSLNSKDAP